MPLIDILEQSSNGDMQDYNLQSDKNKFDLMENFFLLYLFRFHSYL